MMLLYVTDNLLAKSRVHIKKLKEPYGEMEIVEKDKNQIQKGWR